MMDGVGELELRPSPAVDAVFQRMRGPEAVENVVAMVPARTDAELAAAYKREMREAAERVCEISTRARRDDILVTWTMGWDAAGRAFVNSVDTLKPL